MGLFYFFISLFFFFVSSSISAVMRVDELVLPDLNSRADATNYLLSEVQKNTDLAMDLVDAASCEKLLENISLAGPASRLARLSMNTLSIIADTNIGRRRLMVSVKKLLLAFISFIYLFIYYFTVVIMI